MADPTNAGLGDSMPVGPLTLADYLNKLELDHDRWLNNLPDSAWLLEDRGYQGLSPEYELEQLCYFPWFGPGEDDRVLFILTGSGDGDP